MIDSYFTIGSNKRICEDYATHAQVADMEVIVLSDGCSTGKDTDIGARLLPKILLGGRPEKDIARLMIDLDIPREATLCTLLSVKRDDFETEIMLSGDGFCVIQYDWGLDLIEFGSPVGAPYYLSYEIVEGERENYIRQFGNENFYRVTKWQNKDIDFKNVQIAEKKFIIESEPFQQFSIQNNYISISIFSDGLKSFVRGKELMSTLEILQHFLDIKIPNGDFVYRTCRRALKDLEELGFKNFDDFSMATIYANTP